MILLLTVSPIINRFKKVSGRKNVKFKQKTSIFNKDQK